MGLRHRDGVAHALARIGRHMKPANSGLTTGLPRVGVANGLLPFATQLPNIGLNGMRAPDVGLPRWGRFFVQDGSEQVAHRLTYLLQARRPEMAHWRKRNPPASRFNAYLTGWAVAISVLLGAMLLLSRHVIV
jgi:hypothetical protein